MLTHMTNYIVIDEDYIVVDTDIENIIVNTSIRTIDNIESIKCILYVTKDTKKLTKLIQQQRAYQEIIDAIKDNRIYIVYQPQYDIHKLKIMGVEALLRCEGHDGKLLSTREVIDVLEETEYIKEIDRRILKTACMQNKYWQNTTGNMIKVAVNISAIAITDYDLVDYINYVLEESGLDPQWLEIEITETCFIHDIDKAIDIINKIIDLGVGVVLDDFGTKYSTLNILQEVNITGLKIDKSFVDDIGEKSIILNKILEIAAQIGIFTVAEGVETEEQLNWLKSKGCQTVQGYYVGKEKSSEEITKLLNNELT